ncbi:MAG TPA: hypothetical protein VIQ74_07565 [Gemmatimonadaceae bacterium]
MMKSLLVLTLFCLAACGDATRPDGGLFTQFSFDDPVGDTAVFGGSAGAFPALDVRRVKGWVSADSLIFTVEFTNSVAPVSDGAVNSLAATLGVDADNDPETGFEALTDSFPNKANAGVEYWIFIPDLATSHDVEVESIVTGRSTGIFPASYDSNAVTLRIPLTAIGVAPGARFRIVGVVGTTQRSTDLIPDSASYELGS